MRPGLKSQSTPVKQVDQTCSGNTAAIRIGFRLEPVRLEFMGTWARLIFQTCRWESSLGDLCLCICIHWSMSVACVFDSWLAVPVLITRALRHRSANGTKWPGHITALICCLPANTTGDKSPCRAVFSYTPKHTARITLMCCCMCGIILSCLILPNDSVSGGLCCVVLWCASSMSN